MTRWVVVALLAVFMRVEESVAQFRYEAVAAMGSAQINIGRFGYGALVEGPDGAIYGVNYTGGLFNSGVLYKAGKDGSDLQILHYFGGPMSDGSVPGGGLVVGNDGALYGVTIEGGLEGAGTLYRIHPDGSGYRVVFHFQNGVSWWPRGGLVIGDDGAFRGATQSGGRGDGTIYKVNQDGSNFQVLHRFGDSGALDGAAPRGGLVKGSDGRLYGTTAEGGDLTVPLPLGDRGDGGGIIFSVNQDGSDYQLMHVFEGSRVGGGARSYSQLLEASDGWLYGTTTAGGNIIDPLEPSAAVGLGTVFKIRKSGQDFEVIHRATLDGWSGESAHLVELPDGFLWGALFGRGLFRVGVDGAGLIQIPVDTDYRAGLIRASDGALYGVGFGGAFRYDPTEQVYSRIVQFVDSGAQRIVEEAPRAPLVSLRSGIVVGTTTTGGFNSNGTVFAVLDHTRQLDVLASIGTNAAAGKTPNGLAEGTNGFLYGTTQLGGSNNAGVIFRLNADGGGYTNLHHFGGTGDGRGPRAGLLAGGDGYLYGCSYNGGSSGRGVIFRIQEDGRSYAILRHFGATDPDGQAVQAALAIGPDQALYGVANGGGAAGRGTIFRIRRDGSDYLSLRHFAGGSDGANPQAPLLTASDGFLYGTTSAGGDGFGTVYRLRPDGSDYQVLYRVTDRVRDGRLPYGPLVEKPQGVLWGCTAAGGLKNGGTIFRARMDGTDYRVMWSFGGTDPDGVTPWGGLILDATGKAMGTTSGGGDFGLGSVFRFDPEAVVLKLEMAGETAVLRWDRSEAGSDELQILTGWTGSEAVWSASGFTVVPSGDVNQAVISLDEPNRVFRVLRQ